VCGITLRILPTRWRMVCIMIAQGSKLLGERWLCIARILIMLVVGTIVLLGLVGARVRRTGIMMGQLVVRNKVVEVWVTVLGTRFGTWNI
jgi:hypothetical protein